MTSNGVSMVIGPHTRYILSTSGRISSVQRYECLLQRLLKLDIAYLPIHSGSTESPAIDPVRFIGALRGMPCIGGAISRDIKHSVVSHLDEIDESASAVQSVNTVVVLAGGRLKGYNTDVLGFRTAIQEGLRDSAISVTTAVCYGSGGVTSVVTTVLKQLGFRVFLAGRNMQAVEARCAELGVELWRGEAVDLFVNATPASEHPLHEAANFLPALGGCKIAFDHEMPGKYLKEYCDAHNIYHIPGVKMYYPQMAVQWSIFLDGIVSKDEIPALLARADQEK